jgi:hypothetical protein
MRANCSFRSVLLVFLAALAACATLDESQCKTINWRELGARDAFDGQERDRFDSHKSACASYNIQPDSVAYIAGFDEGLRRLCTGSRGYAFGVEGRSYRNTCPSELDAVFHAGYRLGVDMRQESGRIASLQTQIRGAEEQLRRSQDNNERGRLRRQIQNLDADSREVDRRLRSLEAEALQRGYR